MFNRLAFFLLVTINQIILRLLHKPNIFMVTDDVNIALQNFLIIYPTQIMR